MTPLNFLTLSGFSITSPSYKPKESLQALKGERVEERAIVRAYILDPAALAISSQALCISLAYSDVGVGNIIHYYFYSYTI